MANNYKALYDVDIVFCIDATGSMQPCLEMVKANAAKLYEDICRKMQETKREVNRMRVRLIAFRDYAEYEKDHVPPMLTTDFFVLPEQNAAFRDSLRAIEPKGGGDEPEDGLEALGYAIRSNWTPAGENRRRQIIVLWTDASTHNLGFARGTSKYPASMASSFEELTAWWGYTPEEERARQTTASYMDYSAKRLLIYAPDKPWWNTIAANWPNVVHVPTVTGKGLADQDYQEIINLLVKTLLT